MATALILFKLARSRLGGAIVRWSFANATRLMPLDRVHETEKVIAFNHPAPTHVVHVLIVPKRAVPSLQTLDDEGEPLLEEIFRAARHVVQEMGLDESGYTLLANGGAHQDVPQLHFHLIAGERISGRTGPSI